jgi:shikimate kinase
MSLKGQPIIITGFMGAGKTTVAILLSQKLGCAMIDLDDLITEREGRTPQAIIDEDGEMRFRQLESLALSDALKKSNARIIALGGGTWTISDNRALIRQHNGFTIWLDAPFNLCWMRIGKEKGSRPLSRDCKSAQALYAERRAVYAKAILRIEVSENKSADVIASEIIEALSLEREGAAEGSN